jgi:hypothetical protein
MQRKPQTSSRQPRQEILPPAVSRELPRHLREEVVSLTIEGAPSWWLIVAAAALGFVGGVIFTLTQASRPTIE